MVPAIAIQASVLSRGVAPAGSTSGHARVASVQIGSSSLPSRAGGAATTGTSRSGGMGCPFFAFDSWASSESRWAGAKGVASVPISIWAASAHKVPAWPLTTCAPTRTLRFDGLSTVNVWRAHSVPTRTSLCFQGPDGYSKYMRLARSSGRSAFR